MTVVPNWNFTGIWTFGASQSCWPSEAAAAPRKMDHSNICSAVLFPIQMLYSIIKAGMSLLLPARRRDLSGDVVLITGGGRGIGRHLAHEFAKQGAKKVSSMSLYKKQHFCCAPMFVVVYVCVYILYLLRVPTSDLRYTRTPITAVNGTWCCFANVKFNNSTKARCHLSSVFTLVCFGRHKTIQ